LAYFLKSKYALFDGSVGQKIPSENVLGDKQLPFLFLVQKTNNFNAHEIQDRIKLRKTAEGQRSLKFEKNRVYCMFCFFFAKTLIGEIFSQVGKMFSQVNVLFEMVYKKRESMVLGHRSRSRRA
jgi:hypothetical protein